MRTLSKMRKLAVAAALLAGLQLSVLAAYHVVRWWRAPATATARFEGEPLSGADRAPDFTAQREGGAAASFAWPAPRPRLVHFWGTWCEPCRYELRTLIPLAQAAAAELDVIAVAVGDTWQDISRFFAGRIPPQVVLAGDDAHKRFGVSTLPDTYLVDASGALVARFHGPREWHVPGVLEYLRTQLAHGPTAARP